MTANARETILSRIQRANGRTGDVAAAIAEWERIERTYIQTSSLSREETLHLLEDRLRDYGAHVVRSDEESLLSRLREVLEQRGLRRLLVPQGLVLPGDIEATVDPGFTGAEIDPFDAAITECTVAIAETGTLVVAAVPGQGRRALSLVPDNHLCLLRERDVVATVPEAWARLAPLASLPLTLISGPSATSDIEMTRIQGVHGPRNLFVFLVHDGR